MKKNLRLSIEISDFSGRNRNQASPNHIHTGSRARRASRLRVSADKNQNLVVFL